MGKKLRKTILGLLAVVLTTSYVSAQFTFGPRVGFNYTNMRSEFDGQKLDKEGSKFKPGFQVGVVADYALNTSMSIQSGLLFAQQGYKQDFSKVNGPKAIFNLNYLQIPINVQLKFPLGGIDLFVQTGPYLGFGINGKYKYWDENGKRMSNEDRKYSFGSDWEKGELKRFDIGIGFGAGLQFGNIQAGLGYNMGLRNLVNEPTIKSYFDVLVKNYGLALTVTYLFGN